MGDSDSAGLGKSNVHGERLRRRRWGDFLTQSEGRGNSDSPQCIEGPSIVRSLPSGGLGCNPALFLFQEEEQST
jgi:hypothetical protein